MKTGSRSSSIALILAISVLYTGGAFAAIGDHVWSLGFGTPGSASLDGTGHSVAAGNLYSPTDFGGGTLTPVNIFSGDLYMARFDDSGSHVWSRQFTPGNFGATLDDVVVDPAGNIYIAGTIQGNGTIDFGGGPLSGSQQAYLAAFNSAGVHQWSFVAGPGSIRSLAASSTHLYCTGYTYGTMDFGGGPLTSAGGADAFVGAITTAGAHAWSALYGDASDQGGFSLAVDSSGNLLLAASILGTADFGGGPLTSSGTADPCLVKFTAGGTHVWSRSFSGSFTPGGGVLLTMSVAAGSSDEVVLVGEASGTVNFGGPPLTATGSFDVYVAKFDPAGLHQWSALYGGTSHDGARGVALDSAGNLVVTASFLSASISMGGSSLAHSGGFGADYCTAMYDASGAHLWSVNLGTGVNTIRPDFFTTGDIFFRGGAGAGIDFGGGPLAAADLFLVKLKGAVTPSAAESVPHIRQLGANYPNPFHPATTIPFALAHDAVTSLKIFDEQGRLVTTLVSGRLTEGKHTVHWKGLTDSGRPAASGRYFYRLATGNTVETRPMVLVK